MIARPSSSHQRVGNLPTSWFDAVHTGVAPGGQGGQGPLDDAGQFGRLEMRLHEQEIERHVQFRLLPAVIVREAFEIELPRLSQQCPRRRVAVCYLAPVPVDLVDFRAVGVVNGAQPEHVLWPAWSVGAAGGLSLNRASLYRPWATSMRKPAMPRSNQ